MWKTRKKPYSRIAEPPETGARTKRGHHQQRVRIGSNFSAKIASLHTRKTGMAYLIHSMTCKYMWTVHWNKDLLAVSHEKMYFKISSNCCLNVFYFNSHFNSFNTKMLFMHLGCALITWIEKLFNFVESSFYSSSHAFINILSKYEASEYTFLILNKAL